MQEGMYLVQAGKSDSVTLANAFFVLQGLRLMRARYTRVNHCRRWGCSYGIGNN